MTDAKVFRLTIDADHIAWLSIDVSGERVNTLQSSFVDEMTSIIEQLTQEKHAIQAMIIHSLKRDNFIVGADIRMIDQCQDEDSAERLSLSAQSVFGQLDTLPFPKIAAIHGPCLGGGLELTLVCDYRVCSFDPSTCLGLPEVKIGLLPGAGGTQRLPRLIGTVAALDLMLSGKKIDVSKALSLGLIDAYVQPDALLAVCKQVALGQTEIGHHRSWFRRGLHYIRRHLRIENVWCELARRQAQKKAHDHYPAIDALINVVKMGLTDGLTQGLQLEAKLFGQLVMTPQSKALRSLFFSTTALKKRWLQNDANLSEIEHVAILGGGLMGAGICCVSIDHASLPVIVKDIDHQGIVNTLDYCYRWLNKKKARRLLTSFTLTKKMALMTGQLDYTRFKSVDVVIEAVFEVLTLKQQMVKDVEANCSPQTIFATNTSSLPIHQIAAGAQRPANIVGLHYFSPVEKMPLVEIIPHAGTDPRVIAKVASLAYRQGKTPIVVKDSAGFYVNRILVPYIQAAISCLQAGEPVDKIDAALVSFGFPVGPLTLLDEVGFGVAEKIPMILRDQFGERYDKPEVLTKLIQSGRMGKKSGSGFYRYGGRKKVDKQIYAILNAPHRPHLSLDDIAMRCVIPLLNEATRCFHEGVIHSAKDGDIGAIYGIGFPPFLGGPFWYMHHYGLLRLCETMEQYALHFGKRYQPCEELINMTTHQQGFYD